MQAEGDTEWNDYPEKWCGKCHAGVNQPGSGRWNLPKYSEDISAAWEVVEKLRTDGLMVDLTSEGAIKNPGWQVTVEDSRSDDAWFSYADTAPQAICEAALAAVGASLPVETPEPVEGK